AAGIEDRLRRLAIEADVEHVLRVDDLQRYVAVVVADAEAHGRRQPEDRGARVGGLLLLHRDRGELVLGIPADADVELRVSGAIDHPLAEEPVEVLAGRLLDGAREIARLDDAVAVLAEVMREALPERVVAEDLAQHVEDAAA